MNQAPKTMNNTQQYNLQVCKIMCKVYNKENFEEIKSFSKEEFSTN